MPAERISRKHNPMNDLTEIKNTTIPTLIDRASAALLSAKTSADVLEARDMARVAYDAAKSAGRIAKAKKAHDEVIAAVHRAQGEALLIEARAKMRLADEYDGAQERGEVAGIGDNLPSVGDHNSKPTAADIGLRRDEIHEARKLRDAEAADPGKAERVVSEIVGRGDEPTKSELRKALVGSLPVEPEPESEPADPTESKLRKEFRALSKQGQEDAYVGLSMDLQDAKAKIKKQAEEIRVLKAHVKGFEGDQADTIRRQAQIIAHKSSEVFRANEKADNALAQVHALKKQLKAMGDREIALD